MLNEALRPRRYSIQGRLEPITINNASKSEFNERFNANESTLSRNSRNSQLLSQLSQDSQVSSRRTLNPVRVPPNLMHAKESRRQSCFDTLLAQHYIHHVTHRYAQLTPSLTEGLQQSRKRSISVDDHCETSAQFIESVRRQLVKM
uniref:Uncharacterized protein n=1 Tax=Ascaris lumbricoides TaxID=6252 RepID=A0A0M3ICC2_ASCLU